MRGQGKMFPATSAKKFVFSANFHEVLGKGFWPPEAKLFIREAKAIPRREAAKRVGAPHPFHGRLKRKLWFPDGAQVVFADCVFIVGQWRAQQFEHTVPAGCDL